MITFTIPYGCDFTLKYGMNALYAGIHWTKRSQNAKYWHELVYASLKRAKVPQKVFTKPVQITFVWNTRMDIDNHAYMGKMIMDGLKGYLIADDSRKYVKAVIHQFGITDDIQVIVEEYKNGRAGNGY